jgi:hypothetical protein
VQASHLPNDGGKELERVLAALRLLVFPGQVSELRALNCGRAGLVSSVFFDAGHLQDMAAAALELEGQASGVYFTLNPVNPALHATIPNRVEPMQQQVATQDRDVLRRHWLLIDIDPVGPGGVSATREEKRAAEQLAARVVEFLAGRWPAGAGRPGGREGWGSRPVRSPVGDRRPGGPGVSACHSARFPHEPPSNLSRFDSRSRICRSTSAFNRASSEGAENLYYRGIQM